MKMFSHWDQVRSDLISTISKFEEDEHEFVLFDEFRPIGKIMLHMADADDCELSSRKKLKNGQIKIFFNIIQAKNR